MRKYPIRKQIFPAMFLFLGIILSFILCFPVTASYSVQTNDLWTYEVKAAKRTFEYSFGNFKSSISTRGYTLGENRLNVSDKFNLSVLSIQEDPEKVIYELKAMNSAIIVESDASKFLDGIQGALGVSLFGKDFNFLENTSGVSAGESFFICPNRLSWDSIFSVWNQTIPNLEGTLEGIETIKAIESKDTKETFQMIMIYSGRTDATSSGIDLDFTYSADFKWQKKTGVLLYYDIISEMEGTYNNIYSASFSLDLRIERADWRINIVSFDFLFFTSSFILISYLNKNHNQND
ncbi:choice-of-anchor S family protein [Candidatus Hodarchaeum mangrovi]